MTKMTKPAYPGLFHEIHKSLTFVSYPATKEELLIHAGEKTVHTDWDEQQPLCIFIESISDRSYSCAADFYCALIATM